MPGVPYDGKRVWFAFRDKLSAFDLANGKMLQPIDVDALLILRSNTFPIHRKLNDRGAIYADPDLSRCHSAAKAKIVVLGVRKLLKKTIRALDFHQGLSAPQAVSSALVNEARHFGWQRYFACPRF